MSKDDRVRVFQPNGDLAYFATHAQLAQLVAEKKVRVHRHGDVIKGAWLKVATACRPTVSPRYLPKMAKSRAYGQ